MGIAAGQYAMEMREMIMRRTTAPVTRVVVGVDGSAGAATAVQWATAEACWRQVVLRIVSVWDEQDDPGPPRDPARVAAARVQKALTRVLDRQHYPHRIACATPRGAPGQTLLAEAGETGLLVLGLTGAAPVLVPGRVNRYCLQRGRGPLVFVPAAPSVLRGPGRPFPGSFMRSAQGRRCTRPGRRTDRIAAQLEIISWHEPLASAEEPWSRCPANPEGLERTAG